MTRATAILSLLLPCTALSGCGTIENLCAEGRDRTVYGGVDRDMIHAREIYGGVQVNGGEAHACCSLVRDWPYQSTAYFQTDTGRRLDSTLQKFVLGPWLLLVDLPATAVADTLTLPATAFYRLSDDLMHMDDPRYLYPERYEPTSTPRQDGAPAMAGAHVVTDPGGSP